MTPQRIVSLCPSITETLHALGAWDRVVGRTEYCVHPAGLVDAVPTVGGTKRVKVDRLLALEPDLVLANREENRREDVEAIEAAGVAVHVSLPRTVADAADVVQEHGALVGCAAAAAELAGRLREERPAEGPRIRCVYLIWRKPWMAATAECFIGDVLARAGFDNVARSEAGAYPTIEAWPDTDVVLLSSEPFPFAEGHRAEVAAAAGVPIERVVLVDGELLSWHGVRTLQGVRYAHDLAARLRSNGAAGSRARPGEVSSAAPEVP